MFGNGDQLMKRVVWKLPSSCIFDTGSAGVLVLATSPYNVLSTGLRKGALRTSTDAGTANDENTITGRQRSGRQLNLPIWGTLEKGCFFSRRHLLDASASLLRWRFRRRPSSRCVTRSWNSTPLFSTQADIRHWNFPDLLVTKAGDARTGADLRVGFPTDLRLRALSLRCYFTRRKRRSDFWPRTG
ncbi:hypothetical protein OKW40_003379 [Paraburkholderia sp. RAU6.4a]